MLYEAEQGKVSLALCGDIMPSRRLAVFREPEFLALREILRGPDACFANLESMVVRYGEGSPAIRTGTGASAAEVQWVVNIYTLPLAALILLGGALGDHHGRRLWLVIGTATFGVASLICALSPSLEMLLVGRALQGIGAGGRVVLGFAVSEQRQPQQNRR